MRDCTNAEMRDRLPDLMHGRLRGEELAATRAHVTGCQDCREELALLERLRAAAVTPAVRTSRIVPALPRYRAMPAWRRMLQSAQLRAAAAIVLLVGAYATLSRVSGTGERVAIETPRVETTLAAAPAARAVSTQELAIGDSFEDLSDSDLAAVLDALGKLEAVTPDANEELALPIPTRAPGGGGDGA